jgi:hypothetical protein
MFVRAIGTFPFGPLSITEGTLSAKGICSRFESRLDERAQLSAPIRLRTLSGTVLGMSAIGGGFN